MQNKRFTLLSAIFVVLLSIYFSAQAQITVTGGVNAQQMVEELVGNGVQVSNPVINCFESDGFNAAGYGFFDGEFSNIGINSGILLTSGSIDVAADVANGNDQTGATVNTGTGGDAQLDALVAPFTTNDACILEFDFVPYADQLSFNYVFASEEYPEYVCSTFTDVFAFFLSGPGIPGTSNIAVIPGSNGLPVAINTINPGVPGVNSGGGDCFSLDYAEYYVDNMVGFDATIEYDGFTTLLTALANVIPCETYHLKIAIADAGDSAFDSGVFLQSNSLSTNFVEVEASAVSTTVTGFSNTVEGCVNGLITFSAEQPLTTDFPISFTLGGSAQQGIDYTVEATTTLIPQGSNSVSVPLTILEDGIVEGTETISITFVLDFTCGNDPIIQNAALSIIDAMPLEAFGDATILPGQSTELSATGGGGQYAWTPAFSLGNPNSANPIASPLQTTTYTVTSVLGECTYTKQVTVTVQSCDPATDPQAGEVELDDNAICYNASVQASAVGAALLSPEDVQVFVLHNSSTNDISSPDFMLYSYNVTGEFDNDGTYPYNTLYITSIAGDDDGTGFPDLNDPCISISPAVPVTFLSPVTLDIDEYCDWVEGIFYINVFPGGGYPASEVADGGAFYTLSGALNGNFGLNQSAATSFVGSQSTQQYDVAAIDAQGCQIDTLRTYICFKTAVELLYFRGTVENEGNLLTWATASETDNSHFVLQRSDNGTTFIDIATISGGGNSAQVQSYKYKDFAAPQGQSYYRLWDVDVNGTKTAAPNMVVLTRRNTLGFEWVELKPVPVQNELIAIFNAKEIGTIWANLYDVTGRIISTQAVEVAQVGNNTLSLTTVHLSSGTYFLSLNNGKEQINTKFVKY